jgi:hypothetical protein
MLQQTYTPSNTGIESFIRASADYDLAPVGIGSMQEQADRLAEFGRNGDVYVVHAAEGETVIPTEVLDANPQVKEMLFAQMRDMGLNPDEYVVGSELNSINPDTGMPEFFFKKIFKSVKKIIKSAAPLIVPLIGNMILPGIGGILASAVYTKATGGSWGDVLKGAAMSYLGGAVMGGFTAPTGTSFGAGFSQGLAAPFAAASDLSGSWNQGVFGSSGAANAPGASWGDKIFPTYEPAAVSNATMTPAQAAAYNASGAVTTTQLPPEGFAAGPAGGGGWDPGVEFDVSGGVPGSAAQTAGLGGVQFDPVGSAPPSAAEYLKAQHANTPLVSLNKYPQVAQNVQTPGTSGAVPQAASTAIDVGSGSFAAGPDAGVGWDPGVEFDVQGGPGVVERLSMAADKAGDWLIRGGDTQAVVDANILKAEKAYADRMASYGIEPTAAQITEAGLKGGPNIYQRYGPTTALLGVAAYAGGAFDEPKRDPGMSDEAWEKKKKEWAKNKLFAENPGDYVIPKDALNPYKFGNQYANSGGLMELPPRHMNNGGAAQYPRREMLVEGPGTERSDDIPAMLSDGEFVLNSRSVRGADPTGQGNRYRGAQNLYNMMRNFEMRA